MLPAATAVNSTMLAVFSAISGKGGQVSSRKEAMDMLVRLAADQVMATLPSAWDNIAALVDACGVLGPTKPPPFDKLFSMPVDSKVLFGVRFQLLVHILSSLGLQQCLVLEGTRSVPTTYMDCRLHKLLQELAVMYDFSKEGTRIFPPSVFFDGFKVSQKDFKGFVVDCMTMAAEALGKAHCWFHHGSKFVKALRGWPIR